MLYDHEFRYQCSWMFAGVAVKVCFLFRIYIREN
jgi:hypothetical protein